MMKMNYGYNFKFLNEDVEEIVNSENPNEIITNFSKFIGEDKK